MIFKRIIELDDYEKAIISLFLKLYKKVTPTEVSCYLNIHPKTAKEKIERLTKLGLIECHKEGIRVYCNKSKNFDKLKKKLFLC